MAIAALAVLATACSEYTDVGVQRDEAGALTILSGCDGGGLSQISVRAVDDQVGPARFRAELGGANADRFSLSEPLEGWFVEGSVDGLPTDQEIRVSVFERYVASGSIRFVPDELEPGVWYWDPLESTDGLVAVTEEQIIAARSSCSDPAIWAIAFIALAGAVFAFFGWLIWKAASVPPAKHEP
ncbi:MAG: hypothetical protein AAGC53_12235 [Actinomycetota bacterium]